MTIYDFMEMVNDNFEMVFRLFDCNTEDLVCIDGDCEFTRSFLLYSDYAYCEICSVDMWVEDGEIHIEFNVEIEEE